ncbi:sugar phosphate isomerase [Paenibacillus baekrokdamisoli]|uniref:Sugar phosphate isomerase n=1 Tax=Paenibacillus baekrokdamisoli TaxID=1712516 RepID=A0A3G9JB56_9BACL|nr:sugar phosphate isomerase/epimerase [Paenibacillus baekrokdamisoli]MBB3067836.1 sugar phosphate isomerase/epimerase [Paenibacillus baekrokdamisoli]BBH23121.1 sugar phosphate isomerase [Paenibacillus baekrokdamisoli]
MAKPTVALQLYTLRDLTEKDFLGTIRKAAEIGYKAVEFAGYYDTPAKDLKALLEDVGIEAPSAHIGLNFRELNKLESDFAKQIEYAQELGLKYIVTPWAPLQENPTDEDITSLAKILEKAGKQAKQAGIQYGYHNHDFELKLVNGKPALDLLLERVPSEFLIAEFDLGWIHMGGKKPIDYVTRYAGRVPLVHFKDFGRGRSDTEVGKGVVDLKSVLVIAEQVGIEYFVVEQEEFASSSLESAKISLDFFHKNGFA